MKTLLAQPQVWNAFGLGYLEKTKSFSLILKKVTLLEASSVVYFRPNIGLRVLYYIVKVLLMYEALSKLRIALLCTFIKPKIKPNQLGNFTN